jgi:hypothetical protein
MWAGIHFHNEHVFVMGGETIRNIMTAKFEQFSMVSRRWRELQCIPLPISHVKAVAHNN